MLEAGAYDASVRSRPVVLLGILVAVVVTLAFWPEGSNEPIDRHIAIKSDAPIVALQAPDAATERVAEPAIDPPSPRCEEAEFCACEFALRGVVRDRTGRAIAGARVEQVPKPAQEIEQIWHDVYDSSVRGRGTTPTQADGAYTVCVARGQIYLRVTAAGYASQSIAAVVHGPERRDVWLDPGASITGRVVYAEGGAPAAGVPVVVSVRVPDSVPSPERWRGLRRYRTQSDANGAFVVDGVAAGTYGVRSSSAGFASEPREIAVGLTSVSDLTLELLAATHISGRVVERGTGLPVIHAVVFALHDHRRAGAVYSDVTGHFQLEQLLPGDYKVGMGMFMGRSYRESERANRGIQAQSIHVTNAGVTDILFEVTPRASIAGVVTYRGAPVAGAIVRSDVDFIETETDDGGRFSLVGLDAGTHRLYAEAHAQGAFTDRAIVTLTEGETRAGVVVSLDMDASVAGEVLDRDGHPLAGQQVRFSTARGDVGEAMTDDDGAFIVRPLRGGTAFRYEVTSLGDHAPLALVDSEPLVIADASTRIEGFVIVVDVARGAPP